MFGGSAQRVEAGSANSAQPHGRVQIETEMMSHRNELKGSEACVQLCREIGNSRRTSSDHQARGARQGNRKGAALENFIRDKSLLWHQTCTAKMGRDSMSGVVATSGLGIEKLRIAVVTCRA